VLAINPRTSLVPRRKLPTNTSSTERSPNAGKLRNVGLAFAQTANESGIAGISLMSGEDADAHQTTKPRTIRKMQKNTARKGNIPKNYQKQKNPLLKLEKKLAW
jgi:hypothetical protein